ncbi:MAG: hypothetical protein WDA74_09445 [Spirochaetota bacterium]
MKFKKLLLVFLIVFFTFSCKEKPVFVDPAFILMKWGDAVKKMNYRDYAECEAFPKDIKVFNELYKNYYFTDFLISEMGKYKEADIKTDALGKKYNYRTIYFECLRTERKTGDVVESMKGDIEFIKYVDEPDLNRGWLMFNRTVVRIGVDKN